MANRQRKVALRTGLLVQRTGALKRPAPVGKHDATEAGVSTAAAALLGVQRTAGNRVTTQLVQGGLPVQRLKAGTGQGQDDVQIRESVGRGGRNLPNDVATVSARLAAHGVALGEGPEALATAIERFQAEVVGLKPPDGRVDPAGPTLAALRQDVINESVNGDTQLWEDEFRLGRKYVEAGDYSAAAVAFKLIYDDPKFRVEGWQGVLLNLAQCHQRLGEFDLAISYAQEMLDTSDVGPEARQAALDILKASREGTEDPLAAPPPGQEDTQLWEDEFRLGRKYVEAGDYSAAAVAFKLIYDDPKFRVEGWQGVLLNLAQCHQRLGEFDLAISYAQEMLDTSDVGPEAREAALDILKASREKSAD